MDRNDIARRVHELYWNHDFNCARTMLYCLAEAFDLSIHPQLWQAAAGMHGAGGWRAQCGLVEGALLFMGVHYAQSGVQDRDIAQACRTFAAAFTDRFASLTCRDLRPGGFQKSDPPHMCETLTVDAIDFTAGFLRSHGPARIASGPLPLQPAR